jgi:flavin prenyltransferase
VTRPLRPRRIVIAITGASGAAYGIRILEILRSVPDVETHLVVSRAGALTLNQECDVTVREVERLADVAHRPAAVGASIASGSFPVDAMIVAPCSMKTASAIAHSYADDLITRAADVCLKEGRLLLLMVRETPLHVGHLRVLTAAAEAGAIIAPPVPAFYARPAAVADIVDHTARRALMRVGLEDLAPLEWAGLTGAPVADEVREGAPPR